MRTLGQRIRHYREEVGISLSQLAERCHVSKGYLSALENGPVGDHTQRPSAKTLFAIAEALGVTLADLFEEGEPATTSRSGVIPPSLIDFADREHLSKGDVEMLANIKWRDKQPTTADGWSLVYNVIRMTCKDK